MFFSKAKLDCQPYSVTLSLVAAPLFAGGLPRPLLHRVLVEPARLGRKVGARRPTARVVGVPRLLAVPRRLLPVLVRLIGMSKSVVMLLLLMRIERLAVRLLGLPMLVGRLAVMLRRWMLRHLETSLRNQLARLAPGHRAPRHEAEADQHHRPCRRLGHAGRQLDRTAERLPWRREVDGELRLIRGEHASRSGHRPKRAIEQSGGEGMRGKQPAAGERALGGRTRIVG